MVMKINKAQVKRFAARNGADLVGISSASGYDDAPQGCKPTDLFRKAQSVIVMAMRIPFGSATPRPSVSYLEFGYYGLERSLNELAYKVSLFLEDKGHVAMPMPAGRDILSLDIIKESPEPEIVMKGSFDLRRAAEKAGLGQIGANNCLVTSEFGSRVRLVAVLTSLPLEPDPSKESKQIPDFCRKCGFKCVKSCPAKALPGNGAVNHYRCMVMRPQEVSHEKALASFKKRWSYPPLILAAKSLSFTDNAPHPCATCITLCPSDRAR